MTVYIISDLHIGAGALDDCDAGCEDALVAFIDWLRSETGHIELVLNGDSFDFVQAEPWRDRVLEGITSDGVPLCFDEWTSLAKANAILAHHPRFFDALARLLGREGARVTIMPGNHDADLFWKSVREAFEKRLGGDGRLAWHLERRYVPAQAPHIVIEHGHQVDPANCFFHPGPQPPVEHWSALRPPILRGVDGQDRLMECIGTRFLIRYLNGLDERYPFVDNIKPFSRFLAIFGSSIATLRGGTARAALAGLAFTHFLGREALVPEGRATLLSATARPGAGGAEDGALSSIEKASGGALSRALVKAGLDLRGRSFDMLLTDPAQADKVLAFAIAHADALDAVRIPAQMLSIGSSDGSLSLAKGYSLDETKLLKEAAHQLLEVRSGTACVIMGHTHERVDEPRYKSPAAWTRYLQIARNAPAPSWSEMVARSDSLPMAPCYAIATPDANEPVKLVAFE